MQKYIQFQRVHKAALYIKDKMQFVKTVETHSCTFFILSQRMFSENSQKQFKQILRIINLQGCWWILDIIQKKSNANLKSAEQTVIGLN